MKYLENAKQVIELEAQAILDMAAKLDASFDKAIDLLRKTTGRVVILGMGKSGIIGKKIAATFASTGTPSFFVHPGEAFHGDLGMIQSADAAILISNSGETEEIIRILPFLQHQGNVVVALTGGINSTLARHSHAVLDVGVTREACANNLAPTCSTTATLVMGDALAVVLSTTRNFQPEDFARFHPGGSLGKKLLTKVKDVMHKGVLPLCAQDDHLSQIVQTVNKGRLGLALVVDGEELIGIITDGDIRRSFERPGDLRLITAQEIMSRNPKTINENVRLVEAEAEMRQQKLGALVVLSDGGRIAGVLQIFDSLE